MDENKKITEGVLLYDPLFEHKPDTVIRDDPKKGFWGKAIVKKMLFIIVLASFVGVSVYLSFHSVSKEKYTYEEAGSGYMLSEFVSGKNDFVLNIDYVYGKDDRPDASKTVNSVREYALCCNEYTEYIFIGKDVENIENTSFYYCTALRAVIVDKENPCYESVEGVLYKKENGKLTEIVLYPTKNSEYRTALSLGAKEPENAAEAMAFRENIASLENAADEYIEAYKKDKASAQTLLKDDEVRAFVEVGLKYEIAEGVGKVGEMSFAECENIRHISIPESVTDIGSMAFFKCKNLEEIYIPDKVESIGSDGFSYCENADYIFIPSSVKNIGHHAFFGCNAAKEVYMECSEDNMPQVGEDWLPQYRKGVLRDVETVNDSRRRES